MGGAQAVIAGLGLRRGCPGEEIVRLVREAQVRAGRDATALAAPGFKQAEAGLHAAAAALRLELRWVSDAALAEVQNRCRTRSAAAARAVGVASVAEAAALAAAGPGAQLVLGRIASARATCALAEEGS